MLEKIKYWIYGLTLTYSFLFFSIYSIFGIKFEGSEKSLIYIYGTATLSLLSATLGLSSLLKSRFINRICLLFLTLPLLVTFIFLIENPGTKFAFRTYLTFIVIVFPIILIGLDIAKSKSIDRIYNSLYFSFVIVTLAMIRLLPELVSTRLNDLVTVFGGGATQQMSYTISFTYMIGLIKISESKKVIKNWYLKVILFFSLILLFFVALLASGRGAFLVILISSIIFIRKHLKKMYLSRVIAAIVIVYFIFNYLMSELGNRFKESTTRIFSYIGNSGIIIEGTSHRDLFYEKAFNLFSENILLGHGIFRYTIKTGGFYSHNIFLDILIQGGIILMILFLFLMFFFFNKLKKILKHDSKNNLILVFILYSFILLLFSGIYLNESFFWFSLAYVFGYTIKPKILCNSKDKSSYINYNIIKY